MVDMRDVSLVLMSIVFVSQSLAALMKRVPMSKIGGWHNHVMTEGELGWGGLEGSVKGGIESPLDWSQEVLLDIGKSLKREQHEGQGAELIGNDLVRPFKDAVHLGIHRAGNARSDPIQLEELLEFKTSEFSALVMEAAEGMGVATEPGTVEGVGNSAAFLVRESG